MAGTVAAAASRVVGRPDDPAAPREGPVVILEDEAAILMEEDDATPLRG